MQLYTLCMKRGTQIQEHLSQLNELSDHLAAIGEAVSEILKVAILLRSMQDSYSTLVTALLARGDDELTLVFVKQSLLDEEQRRKKPSDSGGSEVALKTDCKYGSKNEKLAIVSTVVNLVILPEIVSSRSKNKSLPKGIIVPKKQNKRILTLKQMRCLLPQWG